LGGFETYRADHLPRVVDDGDDLRRRHLGLCAQRRGRCSKWRGGGNCFGRLRPIPSPLCGVERPKRQTSLQKSEYRRTSLKTTSKKDSTCLSQNGHHPILKTACLHVRAKMPCGVSQRVRSQNVSGQLFCTHFTCVLLRWRLSKPLPLIGPTRPASHAVGFPCIRTQATHPSYRAMVLKN